MHPLLKQHKVRVLILGQNGPDRLSTLRQEVENSNDARFYLDFIESPSQLNEAFIAEAPGLALVFRDLGSKEIVTEANSALRATSGYPPMLLYPEESEEAWTEYSLLGAADFATIDSVNLRKIKRWYHLAASRSLSTRAAEYGQQALVSKFDAKHHFYSVTESLAEALSIFSRDGFLEYCNNRFLELTGYSHEEIIGKTIQDIFYPPGSLDHQTFENSMRERLYYRRRGATEIYETQIYRKNGDRRWVESKAAPLRDIDGRIIGSIGASTDVTERKNLEEQLRWSQKMEAVGRLAGGVAHDFNNLLTAIFGYSDMILNSLNQSDPLYRKVKVIRQSSEAACALTRQLLTISRKNVIQKQKLSVTKILRENLDIIRGLVGERIALQIHEADAPVAIESDPAQLQQIILNLAINARDAMEAEGVLRMSTAVLELPHGMITPRSSLKPGNYLVITVSDTGHGMTREVMSHIFEPFFTTKKGTGTGLGLSTVYAIVKQHKGEVLVDSTLGKGSTFEVYLPVSLESTESVASVSGVVLPGFGSERILLAEDEASVRSLVRDVLEHHGYTVTTAHDGAEALEIALASDSSFDLLLTDIVMPKQNGIELAHELLQHLPTLKIIFMSGYTDDSTIPETVKNLQTPFLAKPFSPDLLATTVRRTLDASSEEIVEQLSSLANSKTGSGLR